MGSQLSKEPARKSDKPRTRRKRILPSILSQARSTKSSRTKENRPSELDSFVSETSIQSPTKSPSTDIPKHSHHPSYSPSKSSAASSFKSGSTSNCIDEEPQILNHPVFGEIDLSYLTRALRNASSLGTKDPFFFEYGAEKEYDRQTRQHYVLKQTFGSNTQVKLTNPKKILEIACGIGLWSLEIGQNFPSCKVIGIDTLPSVQEFDNHTGLDHHEKELSVRQLNGAERAKNVKYQYGDILVPLEFSSCTFDYVFQRDVATVVPAARWAGLLADIYRVLKPNGQIEFVEHSFNFSNPGPILLLATDWISKVSQGLCIDVDYLDTMDNKLLQAGFVDLEVVEVDVPVGEWPADEAQKEQGFLYKLQTKAMFQSMRLWWVIELGVDSEYYDNLCTLALEELEERKCTMKWKIWTARKPGN